LSKAKEYGCDFTWTDTCCIDKENNLEFQESLDSMFNWYRCAEVCIVHLGKMTSMMDIERDPWFKRGGHCRNS